MQQVTREAFINLDMELTGKPLAQCQQNACQQSKHEDYIIHLAQGARAEVEFNWLYAERAIDDLNKALRTEAEAEG